MRHNGLCITVASKLDWKLIGELELTLGPDTAPPIHEWLMMILGPLKLQAGFLNKVLRSAQQAAARAIAAETQLRSRHIHLRVFIPAQHISSKREWGYFTIEKAGHESNQALADHMTDFYLYEE